MKKVLFAIPALALTLFLAYCQKSETVETTTQATPESAAADRGPCPITIHPDNYTSVFRTCGLGIKNTTACSTCQSSTFATGVTTFSTDITFDPASVPITFSIENISISGANLTFVTSTDTEVIGIPAGTCREITIDANCQIQ